VVPAERYEFITVTPIVIEAGTWIGAAATILPGVRIGQDSVVGAGAVVAKDVPALTVERNVRTVNYGADWPVVS
jgi:acetyltransferase-like isoleucine patch superfamily enzyme